MKQKLQALRDALLERAPRKNYSPAQKTAIITAVGIDREGEEFILTSQIALPQSLF